MPLGEMGWDQMWRCRLLLTDCISWTVHPDSWLSSSMRRTVGPGQSQA